MWKKWLVCLLTLLLCITTAMAAEEAENGLVWMLKLYGDTLPEETIQAMMESFVPVTFDCGEVQVTLQNVLYDGVTLHTSAVIAPTVAGRTLVLPFSAGMNDLVCGEYGENLRADTRTFEQAAKEDGKQLANVSAYPKACDDLEVFWGDHRQDAGDTSTLIVYGGFDWLEAEKTIDFCVEVMPWDPAAETWGDRETYLFPVTIHWLGDIETRTYRAGQANDLRYETLTLVKTPLTTYVYVDGSHEKSVGAAIRNEQGEAYPAGMSMDGYVTLDMEALPETVLVEDVVFVADK